MRVTDNDRRSARIFVAAIQAAPTPEDRDKVEEAFAYRLATEREWTLKPFRELEDGYPLGSDVPVYRIGRAIEEVERFADAPTPPPAAEQRATGTPTTPSTDNEPQRAERGTE